MEESVTFKGGRGQKLFGIVHIPEVSTHGNKKVGVNLLNPGIKNRVAPNRLNVKLARRLCERGVYVFRFDPLGVGDSEGELPEKILVADIWKEIQKGLFVPETVLANDFFVERYQINELILAGNCGGAITSLLASERDQRVKKLCLIDTPIFLGALGMSFADFAVEGGERTEWYFSEYLKRALSPSHWYRFVTLKTNYEALATILKVKFKQKFLRFRMKKTVPEIVKKMISAGKLNRLFFDCCEHFVEGKKPILFVQAGGDHGTEIFDRFFVQAYLENDAHNRKYEDLVEIFKVDKANHIYTLKEWQEWLIEKVCAWISQERQS